MKEPILLCRQSEAKLATAAMSDSLTGLPNRRRLFEWSSRKLNESSVPGAIFES